MSERSIRVNELIHRELSHILRTRYREQTVAITLTEVSVSPDLRNGRVFYSVIGDERAKIKARSFFTKEYRNLRQQVASVIILKYFPKLNFVEDESIARGSRVLDILGGIDEQNALAAAAREHGEDHDRDSADADGYVEGPDYVFDEDDLEYARDLEGGDDEDDDDQYDEEDDGDGDSDDEDLDDGEDEFEEFDEENDVEFEGNLDDLVSPETAEGFGGDVIVDEPQIRLRSGFRSRNDKRDQDEAASNWDDGDDGEDDEDLDLDDGDFDDFDDEDDQDDDQDEDGDSETKSGK